MYTEHCSKIRNKSTRGSTSEVGTQNMWVEASRVKLLVTFSTRVVMIVIVAAYK